jgi:uncharacterized membrane protein YdjX (TVP38/TMEM64 family)
MPSGGASKERPGRLAASLPARIMTRSPGTRRFGKRLLLLLLAASMAAAWHFRGQGVLDPAVLQQMRLDHPLSAPGLFVLMYAAAVVACVPSAPFNLAAGFFWGPLWGGVIATIGASIGSVVAFYLARLLFGRPLVRHFDNRIVAMMQQEFDAKGWRYIAFLRLNPIFPTGPLNYVLGLTAIDGVSYGAATVAFLFPPSLAVAAIGHAMSTFWAEGEAARPLRMLLVVSVGVTALLGLKYAARLLNRRR